MIRRAAYVRAQIRLEYQCYVGFCHYTKVGAVIPLVSQRWRPIAIYDEYGSGADEGWLACLGVGAVGDCGHGSWRRLDRRFGRGFRVVASAAT